MKKNIPLIVLFLCVLWFLWGRSSGYMYQNAGSEPGMPFWIPKEPLGPTRDLARENAS